MAVRRDPPPVVTRDIQRNIEYRASQKIEAVLTLIQDAESSGRSTVLIENLRKAIGYA